MSVRLSCQAAGSCVPTGQALAEIVVGLVPLTATTKLYFVPGVTVNGSV